MHCQKRCVFIFTCLSNKNTSLFKCNYDGNLDWILLTLIPSDKGWLKIYYISWNIIFLRNSAMVGITKITLQLLGSHILWIIPDLMVAVRQSWDWNGYITRNSFTLWNWSVSIILNTSIWKELFSIARKLTTNKLFHYFAAFLQYPVVISENIKDISKTLFICFASNSCSWFTLFLIQTHATFSFKCNHYNTPGIFFKGDRWLPSF